MNPNPSLREFYEEWTQYLEQRNHNSLKLSGRNGPVSSRDCQGKKYRWLLFHSNDPIRRLTAVEHETVCKQIQQGRKNEEFVYIVVKFESPVPKVLVMPASRAVRTRLLKSDKAGISWDE